MDYVTLGFNIALAVFVGFGIIFGLIRGLRKTASRGIFLVITAIILLFVTVPITNALLKINLSVDFTYEEERLVGSYPILECIEFFLKNLIGKDFVAENPELVNVIIALPITLLNAIVYLLLFVLCKYLLLPLSSLFYRFTFKPKKKKEAMGFSSFGDDFDFDEVEKEILQENKNGNIAKSAEGVESQPLTTQPLHAIKDASEENDNVEGNGHHVLFEHDNSEVENVHNENPLEEDIDVPDNNAPDVMSAGEEQFGKDGLFIKKEIETPVVESVVSENFDKPSKKDLKRQKKEEKKRNKIQYKKRRLLGGLVGAVVGLFIMCNVCMPIYGIMNIAKDVNKVKLSNLSEEEISLGSSTDGTSDQLIEAYDKSIFAFVSKYTGVETLSMAQFDMLTTTTVNNKKIKLRGDVSAIIETAIKADTLMGKYKSYAPNNDFSNITQAQLTTLLVDCNELLGFAKKVNLADCVGDYIIPIVCTTMVNNDSKFSDNEAVNTLVINALKTLAKEKNINIFDEACNIVDLATYMNDQGLLIKLIKNDLDDPIGIIKNLDSNFGSQFTDKLFKLQTIKVTMPYVLNIALNILEQSTHYGYEEVDYSEILDTVQTSIGNFIQDAINVIQTVDTSTSTYLTCESLKPLGKLLQTIKSSGLINDSTYNKLMDYAVEQIQNSLSGMLPSDLEEYMLDELVPNIAKVSDWENEMGQIYSAVIKLRDKENGILGEIVEGSDLREGSNIDIRMEESVFACIGSALDILDSTVLFGSNTTKILDGETCEVSGTISLFNSLLDYIDTTIQNDVSNSSLKKVTNIIADMKNNSIKSKHKYSLNSTFWKYELENMSSLIIEVYDMIKNEDFDVTENFGKGLDRAKQTTIFGVNTSLNFMSVAFDIVQDSILGENYSYNSGADTSNPQVLNDKIYELFAEVKSNLEQQSIYDACDDDDEFWQKEFVYYKKLKNIAEKSTKLNTIDDAIAIAEDLDEVTKGETIPSEQIFNIVSFAIKDIKVDNPTNDIDVATNNVIDRIADKLSNPTYFDGKDMTDFWQIEFGHISSIMNIKYSDDGEYKVKDNLTSIGKELDKALFGYSVQDDPATEDIDESGEVRGSYLITENDLREVLASAIPQVRDNIANSFDSDIADYIKTALNSIQTNIADTTNITNISFEKELTHMQTLANLEVSSDIMKYPTSSKIDEEENLAEITAKSERNRLELNALGMQLDSIAYAKTYQESIYIYTDKINADTSTNSKFITRNILNTLISNIFNIAKVDTSDIPLDTSVQTNEQKEQLAFNGLIASIQTNINSVSNNDQVMSWQRELGYVNNLVKMNGGVEYTIDNVATNVGANLDAIAFNVKSDENAFDDITYNNQYKCTYIPQDGEGNSLFVTRSAIGTLFSAYLNRVKETEETDDDQNTLDKKALVNDIIINTTASVATTNDDLGNEHYSNYETCLSDVKEIKESIESKMDAVKDGSSALTSELASQIDTLLQGTQEKPVMGVLLTRRMALLILNKIGVPETITDTGFSVIAVGTAYYNNLKTYYEGRTTSNNTQKEYYSTTDSVDSSLYPNPFVTLYNKINTTSA